MFYLQIFNSTLEISCRCIRLPFWLMNINPQSSVRHCIPDVKIKWTNFKFSDSLPWRNSMQVSCNATKVLSMSVLDLQKQLMSIVWIRFGKVFFSFLLRLRTFVYLVRWSSVLIWCLWEQRIPQGNETVTLRATYWQLNSISNRLFIFLIFFKRESQPSILGLE